MLGSPRDLIFFTFPAFSRLSGVTEPAKIRGGHLVWFFKVKKDVLHEVILHDDMFDQATRLWRETSATATLPPYCNSLVQDIGSQLQENS